MIDILLLQFPQVRVSCDQSQCILTAAWQPSRSTGSGFLCSQCILAAAWQPSRSTGLGFLRSLLNPSAGPLNPGNLNPNFLNLSRCLKSTKTRSQLSAGINFETQKQFKWNQPYLSRGSNSLNSASGLVLIDQTYIYLL